MNRSGGSRVYGAVPRLALVLILVACGSTSPAPVPPPPVAAPAPVDAAVRDAPPDAAPPDAAPPDAPPASSSGAMAPIVLDSPLLRPGDTACKVDADCVVIHDVNCCPCSDMGTGVVVNRRRAPQVRARVRNSCGAEVACLTALSNHPTCLPGYPVCADHVCAIQPGTKP